MNAPDGVWAVEDMVTVAPEPVPPVRLTFAQQINRALREAMENDSSVVVGGQLVKYGVAGLTTGLWERYKEQMITYSVSESLMNSATMGLSLAGKRPVTIHVRIDFLASGMCALVNHIPVWYKKLGKLPLVLICQVGKGMGQGPQHSKDLTTWFQHLEGWTVVIPQTPDEAYSMLKEAIFGDKPVLYVIHRELFDAPKGKRIKTPEYIKLCGTSRRHEREFYGDDAPRYPDGA